MSPDNDPEYLTIAQAAEIAGLSAATLQRWVRDGRIPSEVTPDGKRVIRRAELLKRVVNMNRPVPRED